MEKTVGYEAREEMHKKIYSDSGTYEELISERAAAFTLKATIEEIDENWNEELRFRPKYYADEKCIRFPVFFVEIDATDKKSKDVKAFAQTLIDDNTFVLNLSKHSFYLRGGKVLKSRYNDEGNFSYKFHVLANDFKYNFTTLFSNNTLNIRQLVAMRHYNLAHLSDFYQRHVLEKLKFIIDTRIFRGTFINGVEKSIVIETLHLSEDLLLALSECDFKKDNPKLIVNVDQDKDVKLEDAILIVLLHYLGFDVLILSHSGKWQIDQYLNVKLIQQVRDIDNILKK